jgi:tol-pal system protein YbgF
MKRLLTRGAAALSLLYLAGCVTQGDLQDVSRDMDDVKSRLFQMQKDLNTVRSETGDKVTATMKGYQVELETVRKQQADLQAALDSTKVDLQVMTGKVDENAMLAKRPEEEISLLREDLERRLSAVEDRLTKLEKGVEEVQKKLAEPPPAPVAKTPEQLYQQALDTFKAGKFAEAREMFAGFVKQYPGNELVSNAQYWVGETYDSEKKYEQAILEFQDVIKKYPNTGKVPAAMLKQGMSFFAIGDDKSAKYVLKKLTEEYPLADEATAAAAKLKGMK